MNDHSILSGTFCTYYATNTNEFFFNPCESNRSEKVKRNLRRIDDTFFMSEEVRHGVLSTISNIEKANDDQREIDTLWSEIESLFLKEMENLPSISTTSDKKLKRSFRKSQPFWNMDLENLWFTISQAEKHYLNYKVV